MTGNITQLFGDSQWLPEDLNAFIFPHRPLKSLFDFYKIINLGRWKLMARNDRVI